MRTKNTQEEKTHKRRDKKLDGWKKHRKIRKLRWFSHI